jgi:hypothetical protein
MPTTPLNRRIELIRDWVDHPAHFCQLSACTTLRWPVGSPPRAAKIRLQLLQLYLRKMASKSDIDHWQINATVYKDRVEEIHYTTDPARNIRRRPYTKVWKIEQVLGRGGFGEVRLEKNTEDGKVRAVKRIVVAGTNLSIDECGKELNALLEFSKPKASQIWIGSMLAYH